MKKDVCSVEFRRKVNAFRTNTYLENLTTSTSAAYKTFYDSRTYLRGVTNMFQSSV